jgi:hypothetical protein
MLYCTEYRFKDFDNIIVAIVKLLKYNDPNMGS